MKQERLLVNLVSVPGRGDYMSASAADLMTYRHRDDYDYHGRNSHYPRATSSLFM